MRLITGAFAMFFAVAAFGPGAPAEAMTTTWCLGLDNNKNILAETDCPLVTANEVGGDLEVWVTTQSDVRLEQFGLQWDPAITALGIDDITIFGESLGTASDGTLTWELNSPNLFAQMDGFGSFDVVFNLTGHGSNNGIAGTGDGAGFAALYFVILGGSLSDFGVSFGPNCHDDVGCIQAAKISSEQLGYAGGYVSNVPLPAAVWLFLSALAGLFGVGYRRRSRAA